MLDFIGINFRICGISIDPGHPSDVFDVGYVPFERSPEAAISRGAAAKASVAIVFRSTVRVAWSSPVKFLISATFHLFEI